MFFVDSKRQITVIPTASTYTSSRNVFHDTTNNGINYGSIIARKNGRLIDYATWRRFPTLIANCPLNEDFSTHRGDAFWNSLYNNGRFYVHVAHF